MEQIFQQLVDNISTNQTLLNEVTNKFEELELSGTFTGKENEIVTFDGTSGLRNSGMYTQRIIKNYFEKFGITTGYLDLYMSGDNKSSTIVISSITITDITDSSAPVVVYDSTTDTNLTEDVIKNGTHLLLYSTLYSNSSVLSIDSSTKKITIGPKTTTNSSGSITYDEFRLSFRGSFFDTTKQYKFQMSLDTSYETYIRTRGALWEPTIPVFVHRPVSGSSYKSYELTFGVNTKLCDHFIGFSNSDPDTSTANQLIFCENGAINNPSSGSKFFAAFSGTSRLTLHDAATVDFSDNSQLYMHDQAKIHMDDAAVLTIRDSAKVFIRNSAYIDISSNICISGSAYDTYGSSTLKIDNGGRIYLNTKASINMSSIACIQMTDTLLKIDKGGMWIGPNKSTDTDSYGNNFADNNNLFVVIQKRPTVDLANGYGVYTPRVLINEGVRIVATGGAKSLGPYLFMEQSRLIYSGFSNTLNPSLDNWSVQTTLNGPTTTPPAVGSGPYINICGSSYIDIGQSAYTTGGQDQTNVPYMGKTWIKISPETADNVVQLYMFHNAFFQMTGEAHSEMHDGSIFVMRGERWRDPSVDFRPYQKNEGAPILELTDNVEVRFHDDIVIEGNANGLYVNNEKVITQSEYDSKITELLARIEALEANH